MPPPPSTITYPEEIPPYAEINAMIRERLGMGQSPAAIEAGLVARFPILATLAPVPVLARWLGVEAKSIYTAKRRPRKEAEPKWPQSEHTILGLQMWPFITIAMYRATDPYTRGWNRRKDGG